MRKLGRLLLLGSVFILVSSAYVFVDWYWFWARYPDCETVRSFTMSAWNDDVTKPFLYAHTGGWPAPSHRPIWFALKKELSRWSGDSGSLSSLSERSRNSCYAEVTEVSMPSNTIACRISIIEGKAYDVTIISKKPLVSDLTLLKKMVTPCRVTVSIVPADCTDPESFR